MRLFLVPCKGPAGSTSGVAVNEKDNYGYCQGEQVEGGLACSFEEQTELWSRKILGSSKNVVNLNTLIKQVGRYQGSKNCEGVVLR